LGENRRILKKQRTDYGEPRACRKLCEKKVEEDKKKES
jgi:hypothetical protein